MTLSEISIRRPVFAWMLMFGLIVFGAISFQRMGISQMPDVDFPVVNIALQLDNAAPEVMEMDVVDIIEDAVMGIEGLTNVTSSVSQGIANITCEFKLNHNIDVALQEVQNRITQSSNLLPTALYPPVITKTNPEDQPIMWVMVTADENIPLYQADDYARNTLKDQLSTIAGVGNITFAGYVDSQSACLGRHKETVQIRTHVHRYLERDSSRADRAARRPHRSSNERNEYSRSWGSQVARRFRKNPNQYPRRGRKL